MRSQGERVDDHIGMSAGGIARLSSVVAVDLALRGIGGGI